MRLALIAVALALPVTTLAAGPAAAQSPATATTETIRCAEYGAKRPGNAATRAMGDHLAARFRGAGLETSVESFELPSYVVRKESIAVVAPAPRSVPGESFAFGGTGTVEAEVVDVGTGRESDYSGVDAKGKIVMVSRNEAFHRSSQLTQIVAHGGAAMLYVSGSPDNLVQTGTVRFAQQPPGTIPTVTVGATDGAALRDQLDEGLRMRISVDADRTDSTGRNIIGVRRGTTHPDRIVMVAGHYDSWHSGAVDNCSSMGSLLQILDETKATAPAYTTIFAAWDAEEIGLTGAYDWVMRHQDLVPKIVADVNLEMVSAATYLGPNRVDAALLNLIFATSSPVLNGVVEAAAARNGFGHAPTTANGVRAISGGIIPTDLQPFYSQGVQGFSTFSSTPYYHTRQESPDKIDPISHLRVTRFLRDVVVDLQRVPPEGLLLREVPKVDVRVAATAVAGEAVPVEVQVTDPAGRPVTGVPVRVLVNQKDHWPMAEGPATELGAGRYLYVVPRGSTAGDTTALTAVVDTPLYRAEGYGSVDQRSGGVLPRSRSCVSRRLLTLKLRRGSGRGRVTGIRARSSAGKVRVLRDGRIRVDLRGTAKRVVTVKLTARRGGRTVRETRVYRTCTSSRR